MAGRAWYSKGLDLTRCLPDGSDSRAGERRRYGVGTVIAAKYRLESLLGEGGMGSVWRAFNIQLEAPVAIKVIRGDVDRELSERLRQEARAAAKLGHAAIVRVFDVGESEFGDPFIVMELLSGQSLGALLGAEQRLPAARAVQLLLPVVDALSVAHAKGIIHCDLKPDNVFIAVDNGQTQPKLVDFGIVKMSDRQLDGKITQEGIVIGSPQYMSPEQARGREDLDYRTDIWSLCVVLYEAVSGHVPFTSPNYNAVLSSIQIDDPPSLAELLAGGNSGLWRIIQSGLAKEPAERFQSMAELGQTLATWLVSQGVLEDACGTSLEAKWLNRPSDSHARRRAPQVSKRGLTPPRLLLLGVLLMASLAVGIAVRRSGASNLVTHAAEAQACAAGSCAACDELQSER